MGKEKAGFLTPKAISNRIKAKGLQKLRWYCQMCNKQCRDENGYKCHTASESHHRQMKLFLEDGQKFISNYSSQFLKGYLDIVRRQFGGKRVHANVVYQEYIKDKDHIHMNATRWHSLTGLCLFLGKQGICRAEETEKGWFIEYIDQDPEAQKRREASERLKKTEDEENRKFLEKQIQSCLEKQGPVEEKTFTPLQRDSDEPLRLGLSLSAQAPPNRVGSSSPPHDPDNFKAPPNPAVQPSTSSGRKLNPLALAEKKAKQEKSQAKSLAGTKRSALDEIRDEEERMKEIVNRKDYWLATGIEVKLINEHLPKNLRYHRAKVLKMLDNYTALVQMVKCGTKLKIDQDHAQTVLPNIGGRILYVNGAYRGEVAVLKSADKEQNTCDVVIDSGLCKGRTVAGVSLDDVCKLSS